MVGWVAMNGAGGVGSRFFSFGGWFFCEWGVRDGEARGVSCQLWDVAVRVHVRAAVWVAVRVRR